MARKHGARRSSNHFLALLTLALLPLGAVAQESQPAAEQPAAPAPVAPQTRTKARKPAQDVPRFQPPRPPPLEQEFEDPSDEDFDVGDQPNRIPPPPPGGQNPAGGAAPAPVIDYKPSSASKVEPGKVRFQIVEGAFYEKGKPRGRAPLNKRQ